VIIRKLAEQWAGHDPNSVEGFNKYLFEKALPILISAPFKPDFDINDAGSHLVKNIMEDANLFDRLYI
jgi:hypothetical protein